MTVSKHFIDQGFEDEDEFGSVISSVESRIHFEVSNGQAQFLHVEIETGSGYEPADAYLTGRAEMWLYDHEDEILAKAESGQ